MVLPGQPQAGPAAAHIEVAAILHILAATVLMARLLSLILPTLLDQTITVTTSAPGSASNGTSFDVAANSSSGLLVTITTTGVCSGGDTDGTATITMTSGTGTCTVHFNQAGNGTYNPASEVTEDVTATAAVCYTLTLSSSANGGDPIANPVKSTACALDGQYVAGELIGLTASPDAGYRVAGWTGTNNDFSLSTTNAVTMPASARSVNVSYDVVSNKTYYVNNTNLLTCSDLGTGLTQAAPFCTIGKGASIALAGDTVRVLAGTYAETVNGPNSGSVGNPITYSAAAGVTVTGNGTATGSAFRMTSKSYIVVDGFTITNTVDDGIYVNGSNNITIQNNHVSYSGSPASGSTRQGIYFTSTSNSLITGNTSDHNSQDGIRLTGSCTNVTVSNNVTFANAEQWRRNATGIQVTGPDAANNTIIHNTTYANEDSGLQFYDGAHDNLVLGNLSYGNGDHGIDQNAASPSNIIIGNTVQGNVTAGINLEGIAPGSGGATVVNNILVDNGLLLQVGGGTPSGQASNLRVDAQSLSGTTLDYNIFYLNSGTVQIIWGNTSFGTLAAFKGAVPGQETHGLQANPLFVAPAPVAQRPASAPYNVAVNVGNYHLTTGSPAIDSANADAPNEPALDIEGNARVDDLLIADTGAGTRTYDDRGAFEYQPPCYALTLSHTGEGSDPVASPPNSTGCSAGQYVAGESITLSGAVPTIGWSIIGWTGTDNDASLANTNMVTMPASAHSASVIYIAGASNVEVYIGNDTAPIANYVIPTGQAVTPYYDGVAGGPVQVVSTNAVNILASEHRNYYQSFSETLGYPDNQLTTKYWFTRYAYNSNVKTWLLIANPNASGPSAEVSVYIGDNPTPYTYSIPAGQTVTPYYDGVVGGPVQVVSTNAVNILASEHRNYYQSFSETLGYPDNQLTTKYWFTRYAYNANVKTWLLIANPNTSGPSAEVSVYIGDNPTPYTYSIPAGQTFTPFYVGVVGGPVQVVSTNAVNILASEHRNYYQSFSETLGYPDNQLTTKYWFTRYAYNANVKTWLLIANPNASGPSAEVSVYVGDNPTPYTYSIPAGQAVTPYYAGVAGGPVQVVSTNAVNILASEHRNYYQSFSETLGYPDNQLTTKYWFTRYAYNANVKTWLLIANPE